MTLGSYCRKQRLDNPEWKDISNRNPVYKSYLGLVQVVTNNGRRAGAPLGVGRWKYLDGSDSYSPRQGEGNVARNARRAFHRTPWNQDTRQSDGDEV
jgi:hypothetical protein